MRLVAALETRLLQSIIPRFLAVTNWVWMTNSLIVSIGTTMQLVLQYRLQRI